jgi:general stress protein CsbA
MTTNLQLWLTDTRERVFSTFLASFAVWLTALDTIDPSAHWLRGAVASLFPTVLVVLFQAIPQLTYTGRVWWIDASFRVGRSFLQGFLGALAAGGVDLVSMPTYRAAAIAGGLAAWAAVKTIVARWIPGTVTPASLARGV